MSYERRLLHGKIDILRAELVARLQQSRGARACSTRSTSTASTDILTGKAAPAGRERTSTARSAASRTRRPRTTARAAARCSRRASRRPRRRRRSRPTRSPTLDARARRASKARRSSCASGGGRAGESFMPSGERTRIGRSPDCEIFLDDVTVSRNHAVLVEQRRDVLGRGRGLAERHVRQPPAHRPRDARERRRAPDREVPADLHRMSADEQPRPRRRERLIRIGEVVRRLRDEFPDVSISKIRFLEDEGLLAPRRTQGGYRLFSEDDLERLETILRLQRDEFLPLRVIRDELDAPGANERKRRRPAALGAQDETIDLDELCERAGDRARAGEGARGLRAARAAGHRRRASATRRPTPTSPRLRPAHALRRRRPATCGRSGRRPTARRRCSSSSSRRRCAARNPERRAAGPARPATAGRAGAELSARSSGAS